MLAVRGSVGGVRRQLSLRTCPYEMWSVLMSGTSRAVCLLWTSTPPGERSFWSFLCGRTAEESPRDATRPSNTAFYISASRSCSTFSTIDAMIFHNTESFDYYIGDSMICFRCLCDGIIQNARRLEGIVPASNKLD